MSRPAIRRLPWPVLVVASVMTIGLSLPAAGWDPSPTLPPAEPVEALPPLVDGDVAVRFSVAPTDRGDTDIDVLTRWRSCGVVQDDLDYFPPEAYDIGPAAIGHVTTTADEVRVRLDVAAGPDGEPCAADRLVRVAVKLDEKLGDRSIVDAADDRYAPIVNRVDGPDLGLTYCGYSVAELLGPGLDPATVPDLPRAMVDRIVRVTGDELHQVGMVSPKGEAHVDRWRWRSTTQAWGYEYGYQCELRADWGPNLTGAWWKVRAKRADPGSRYVEAWVYQDVCGHYPWSRDTHQMRVAIGDALYIALATTQIGYDEHGIRIEGRAGIGGIATRASAGKDVYAPVDCQGFGPGTYRLDVRPKLKKWTLYDAGVFPPKRRWPLEPTRGDPAS